MKNILLAVLLAFTSTAYAGKLIKLHEDATTYIYTGSIYWGDQKHFAKIPDGSTLFMKSPGGDTAVAFQLYDILKDKQLKIFSFNCYSSCAIVSAAGSKVIGDLHFHKSFMPNSLYASIWIENKMRSTGKSLDEVMSDIKSALDANNKRQVAILESIGATAKQIEAFYNTSEKSFVTIKMNGE